MAILLVTNDFPPALGGIQSYLRDFVGEVVSRTSADNIIVFASTQDAEAAEAHDAGVPYTVIRWPRSVMLPTPATARALARIIKNHDIDTVWFGAAAPLALMAPAARRAGAERIVSTTHGHEVGWSMLPGARQVLRLIGRSSDVVTYVSEYTRRRFTTAFGPHPRFVPVPSGVDTCFFHPADENQKAQTRARFGYGDAPLVAVASRLVPRKGQDELIRAWPSVLAAVPGARLAVIGDGRYGDTLRGIAEVHGVKDSVCFHGSLTREDMRDLVAAADVFAMPARTRGGGLDVEGLGIVYLEAQSCAVPVVAGRSGGAPETVTPETGVVVDGNDTSAVASAVIQLLLDPAKRRRMGRAGRAHVKEKFSWGALGDRLLQVLAT